MIGFARVCESIAATTGKIEKVRLLTEYLSSLDDADLEAATRFFTGNPFAQREQKNLSLGGSTILAAARHVWGFTDSEIASTYREHGDLGAALSHFVRPSLDLGLFREALTPASLKVLFDEIATASGKSAAKRRLRLCERIFASCSDPLEATYIVKIMTGDLRIGLREGLVLEAIARAFDASPEDIRRASMAAGDVGSIAVAAKTHTLHGIAIAYGTPLGFMLASPLQFGSSYRELRKEQWIVEDKFDGIRAQAHKEGTTVRLFSRTLNDISHSYPEVVAALRNILGNFILDGELVAQRNGTVLPFRYLQTRLQRKIVSEDLLSEIPVVYMCFDILAVAQEYLLDEPLLERRKRLAAIVVPQEHCSIAGYANLEAPDNDSLHARFEDARKRGHEGLLLKRADSPYHPGRRGKWWLKLKRELSTLDVVVVAVEWGHGKRAKVLSDYTFAIRGENGDLLTIGKAYSGLTDIEIATLTEWFLAHKTGHQGHALAVEPKIVLEVAFDVIQPSELHDSGFSLRFPRIARIREDKPASEIDTIDRVREIYGAMLDRERVEN